MAKSRQASDVKDWQDYLNEADGLETIVKTGMQQIMDKVALYVPKMAAVGSDAADLAAIQARQTESLANVKLITDQMTAEQKAVIKPLMQAVVDNIV